MRHIKIQKLENATAAGGFTAKSQSMFYFHDKRPPNTQVMLTIFCYITKYIPPHLSQIMKTLTNGPFTRLSSSGPFREAIH